MIWWEKILIKGVNMNDDYELLNLKEGANGLKVSIHTMRAWVFQKKIPVVRLGRRVLLRRVDLENLIDKNIVAARKDV